MDLGCRICAVSCWGDWTWVSYLCAGGGGGWMGLGCCNLRGGRVGVMGLGLVPAAVVVGPGFVGKERCPRAAARRWG